VSGAEDHTEVAVRQVIAEQCGVTPQKVCLHTRLAEDLGVDGDDATELLSSIADRFKVDFSGLRYDRHFGPEGFFISLAVRDTIKPSPHYPLTVQDLVDAVTLGTFTYDYEHRPFVLRRPWGFWIMFAVLVAVASGIAFLVQ
jgi:acyl carrier protein